MCQGKKILAIITARGGSKRIPGKNIAPLGGRPLIAWAIDVANGSRYLDRAICSTDSPEIRDVARGCGCEVPFLRPAALSGDGAKSVDGVLHARASTTYLVARRSCDDDIASAYLSAPGSSVDIDTEDDLNYAKYLLEKRMIR